MTDERRGFSAVNDRLREVSGWHDRLSQGVWGLSHDLSENVMDMDDRVDDTVRYRALDQLHSAVEGQAEFTTLVE